MSQLCPLSSVHQKHLKGKKSWERGWVIRFVVWLSPFDWNFCKKDGLFLSPHILEEIKDLSIDRQKPSEQDRLVDDQTRMKWKYGWQVWSHLSFFFFYYFVKGVCVPPPSALDPYLVGPRHQNIARLNTRLLFSFEVVVSFRLHTKHFFCFCFNYKWYKKIIKQWSFVKRQTSGTSSDIEWQRVITNENEWYNEWQEWYNEWYRVVQQMTRNETIGSEWYSKWQWMTTNDNE